MDTCVMFLLHLCLFLLAVLQRATGNEHFVWEYFYRPGNIAILDNEFRSEGKVATRLDCVSRCIQCPAVAFDEVTRECRHYTHQNYTIVPVLGDASHPGLWISKQLTLTSAQLGNASPMTHTEANILCQQLGGQLATYRELSAAGDAGFHLCRCGWLSDGTARYVLHYDEPTCEFGQYPGLHTCKTTNDNGQRVYDTHYRAAYCKYSKITFP